jgi:hypothetical protein
LANCWICGAPATTGEHKIKRSDLRLILPEVSQKKPIFVSGEARKSIPVGGYNSDQLKFAKSICANCNNSRTQAHDKAWEKTAGALLGKRNLLAPRKVVNFKSIFGAAVSNELLNMHLYFIKLFGCQIVEQSVPIDLRPLAHAIISNSAHPNVYLTFLSHPSGKFTAGILKVGQKIDRASGRCVVAGWSYILGPLTVQLLYAVPPERPDGLIGAWHPRYGRHKIKILALNPSAD